MDLTNCELSIEDKDDSCELSIEDKDDSGNCSEDVVHQQSNENEESDVNKYKIQIKEKINTPKIDFTKTDFTPKEKELIRKEVELIKEKYPKYIPVIVRPKDKSIQLLRYKFLVNGEITVGQFMCIIRKKIRNIKSSEALFLIVNNSLLPSVHLLSFVYTQQVDKETNMLFFTLCNENTFGKN